MQDQPVAAFLRRHGAIGPNAVQICSDGSVQLTQAALQEATNGGILYRLLCSIFHKDEKAPALQAASTAQARLYNWNLLQSMLQQRGYKLENDVKTLIVAGDTEILLDTLRDVQNHLCQPRTTNPGPAPTSKAVLTSKPARVVLKLPQESPRVRAQDADLDSAECLSIPSSLPTEDAVYAPDVWATRTPNCGLPLLAKPHSHDGVFAAVARGLIPSPMTQRSAITDPQPGTADPVSGRPKDFKERQREQRRKLREIKLDRERRANDQRAKEEEEATRRTEIIKKLKKKYDYQASRVREIITKSDVEPTEVMQVVEPAVRKARKSIKLVPEPVPQTKPFFVLFKGTTNKKIVLWAREVVTEIVEEVVTGRAKLFVEDCERRRQKERMLLLKRKAADEERAQRHHQLLSQFPKKTDRRVIVAALEIVQTIIDDVVSGEGKKRVCEIEARREKDKQIILKRLQSNPSEDLFSEDRGGYQAHIQRIEEERLREAELLQIQEAERARMRDRRQRKLKRQLAEWQAQQAERAKEEEARAKAEQDLLALRQAEAEAKEKAWRDKQRRALVQYKAQKDDIEQSAPEIPEERRPRGPRMKTLEKAKLAAAEHAEDEFD
eukprot:TRINITY_DN40626_c0_g1_i1.p1 TRINITY_DN40626_c0_g1~~TRINITY_DN40626_c0_g1_i1.p1  ORF type:complete len:609 (-),score=105.71 TRINITY_DN40626_c0_g1_i1:25-1851(-)